MIEFGKFKINGEGLIALFLIIGVISFAAIMISIAIFGSGC